MRYRRNDQFDSKGSFLVWIPDEDLVTKIMNLFGYPTDTSRKDENGFQYQMIIEDIETGYIVTLYDRYNEWRLGAHNEGAVAQFLDWLDKFDKATSCFELHLD